MVLSIPACFLTHFRKTKLAAVGFEWGRCWVWIHSSIASTCESSCSVERPGSSQVSQQLCAG